MSDNKGINSTVSHKKTDGSIKETEYSSSEESCTEEKRCEDCDKLIVDDEYGACVEKHTHTSNGNKGYLCSRHWGRSLNRKEARLKGKCDQCCWWEIT